jgi:hypothetical protein
MGPACAGVTVNVAKEIPTKTIVMPAKAGIPFSVLLISWHLKYIFSADF